MSRERRRDVMVVEAKPEWNEVCRGMRGGVEQAGEQEGGIRMRGGQGAEIWAE